MAASIADSHHRRSSYSPFPDHCGCKVFKHPVASTHDIDASAVASSNGNKWQGECLLLPSRYDADAHIGRVVEHESLERCERVRVEITESACHADKLFRVAIAEDAHNAPRCAAALQQILTARASRACCAALCATCALFTNHRASLDAVRLPQSDVIFAAVTFVSAPSSRFSTDRGVASRRSSSEATTASISSSICVSFEYVDSDSVDAIALSMRWRDYEVSRIASNSCSHSVSFALLSISFLSILVLASTRLLGRSRRRRRRTEKSLQNIQSNSDAARRSRKCSYVSFPVSSLG